MNQKRVFFTIQFLIKGLLLVIIISQASIGFIEAIHNCSIEVTDWISITFFGEAEDYWYESFTLKVKNRLGSSYSKRFDYYILFGIIHLPGNIVLACINTFLVWTRSKKCLQLCGLTIAMMPLYGMFEVSRDNSLDLIYSKKKKLLYSFYHMFWDLLSASLR